MQARAQAEIDQVVGRDRLPTAADEKSLPYTRAIIKVRLAVDQGASISDIQHRKLNVSTTPSGWVPPT